MGKVKDMLIKALGIVGTVILGLLVFAIAALPAVFINTIYGYLPIIMLTVLLIISLGSLVWQKKHILVETDLGNVRCLRGGSVSIELRLYNSSRVFFPKANAFLRISDIFGGNDSTRRVSFTMAGKEEIDFGFDMNMPHIGTYSVGLEQVEIYDFFCVFRCRVPLSGCSTAFVTPRIRPMDELHPSDVVLTDSDTDTRITVFGGTDYTGVREYAIGDPMKQIHWKLSAHSRQYVTKIQESSRQQEYVVILDFAANPSVDKEQLMDINDCLIETALSLIEGISRHDAVFALLYCNRNGNIVRTAATGRDNDIDLVRSFSVITPQPDSEYPDACRILQQEGQQANRSTNAIVVTSRATPELLIEMQRVKRQKRSPELYLVVPASWNSRELEKAAAPLKQLESMEIPYYLISTSENLK
jgi:uncharacterized protein (DUF58 family)